MALRQLTGLSSPRITPNRSPEHAIFAMLSEYFSRCVIVFFILSFFCLEYISNMPDSCRQKNKYRTLFWAVSRHMVDFFCNLSILRKKGVILMKVKYIFLIMLLLILAVCLTACASYNTPDKDWPTYDSMSTAVNISFF